MVKINKNKTVLSTIPESPLHADRFPTGAVENYLAEDAAAEQSFLDEVAETVGKDPIAFRLELLDRAMKNPVGEKNDYDASR